MAGSGQVKKAQNDDKKCLHRPQISSSGSAGPYGALAQDTCGSHGIEMVAECTWSDMRHEQGVG
eukprot:2889910-Prymnesium_polylepis.1